MSECVRTCLGCKHFDFQSGDHGYSEYTPGSEARMECAKRVWTFSFYGCDDLKATLETAANCKHYAFDPRRAK